MFRTFTEDFSVQFVDLVFLLSRAPVWRFSLTVRFKCQFIVIIIIIIIIIIINMLIKSVELQLSTDNVSFLITFRVHLLVVFFLFVSLSYVVRKIESSVKKADKSYPMNLVESFRWEFPTMSLTRPFISCFVCRLSRRGRTVIFSLHQPRFTIFKLFDRLSLLAAGRCAFHGPASQALSFFESLGLRMFYRNYRMLSWVFHIFTL